MGDTGEIGLREHVSNTRHQWPKHRIVREYDAQQEALRLALVAMGACEWQGKLLDVWIEGKGIKPADEPSCPECRRARCVGHAPYCQLAGAIKEVEGVLGE